MTCIATLPDRAVIAIEGDDRVGFLQGLVSNDVAAARPGQAVWAALLTPQGKWLADFFILSDGARLLLDCERAQADDLLRRLSRYRLRMQVMLRAEPDWTVQVAWDGQPDGVRIIAPEGVGAIAPERGGAIAPDPRLADFAWRILTPAPLPTNARAEDWDRRRLRAGLPDGSRDMESDRSVLLEAGFDELGGVSWSKGCYMGQELTARTKYRGLIKRRLVPVAVDGPLPPAGTPVLRDGVEVGLMRSGRDDAGLATLRLEALEATLRCGEATLTPRPPAWMKRPETVG